MHEVHQVYIHEVHEVQSVSDKAAETIQPYGIGFITIIYRKNVDTRY